MQRKIWILVGVLLLSTSALMLVASQTWADFTHTSDVLISRAHPDEFCSAVKPRLATSPNGHQLAVAWVQETEEEGDCRAGGFAALRWATEESSYTGWATPLQVFLGSASEACVNHVDVAVDSDNVAHVVATIQDPCDLSSTDNTSVHYRACTLSGAEATCSSDTVLASGNPQEDGFYLLETAIAVSDDGTPFVVYGRRQIEGNLKSEIWATSLSSSESWATPFQLSESTEKAHRPQLDWGRASDSQGYVHIVWEMHEPATQQGAATNGKVRYIRCPEDAANKEACGNSEESFLSANVYPRPDIAVSGPDDRVVIVWNRYDTYDQNPPCEEFGLYYDRSDNNGDTFKDPREVISDLDPGALGAATYKYNGTEEEQGTSETEEYISYLRPVVDMDSDGVPVIAWQAALDTPYEDSYFITTTQAITWKSTEGINWQQEDRWGLGGDPDQRYINPDIAVASPDYEPDGGMHMVYLKPEWVTWDGGAQGAHRYRVYYSYHGAEQFVAPTPSPTTDESIIPTATPSPTPNPHPYQSPNQIYLPLVMRAHS